MKELDSIHHLTIHVSDVARAVRWYSTSFHCDVVLEEPTFAELRFENLLLRLCLPSQEPQHIGFEREDAASFGVLGAGRDGRRSLYLADPTGNVVELIEDSK